MFGVGSSRETGGTPSEGLGSEGFGVSVDDSVDVSVWVVTDGVNREVWCPGCTFVVDG